MTQRRQRIADFEARSVQLIAACALGLAGMASAPLSHAARITGQTASQTSPSSDPARTGKIRVSRAADLPAHAGEPRN